LRKQEIADLVAAHRFIAARPRNSAHSVPVRRAMAARHMIFRYGNGHARACNLASEVYFPDTPASLYSGAQRMLLAPGMKVSLDLESSAM
jgi:hypothetical protein